MAEHVDHKKSKRRSSHGSSHEGPTKAKARKMLKDKKAQGKPLSVRQRGLFGLIAGGGTPTRMRDVR